MIVAYILMLLMAVLFAAFVGYRIYHSHARSYARRLRREARAAEQATLKRSEAPRV
ncbi:hypothetical protein LZK98_06170 [Sphingomonas cannabina]|uniref:hypothetical protein n=1 Tax=Sphingomonas cannabina TaxID=2899123 RepID=UPI001F46E149|nr:hypothetical protein [Sphingomonas cannabina]UIJ46533.1 hypothetical protein LZK98_06170 [Sphingomonas cannabina]